MFRHKIIWLQHWYLQIPQLNFVCWPFNFVYYVTLMDVNIQVDMQSTVHTSLASYIHLWKNKHQKILDSFTSSPKCYNESPSLKTMACTMSYIQKSMAEYLFLYCFLFTYILIHPNMNFLTQSKFGRVFETKTWNQTFIQTTYMVKVTSILQTQYKS